MKLTETELRSVLAVNVTQIILRMQKASETAYPISSMRDDLNRCLDLIEDHDMPIAELAPQEEPTGTEVFRDDVSHSALDAHRRRVVAGLENKS
jgi:hypothetical protein